MSATHPPIVDTVKDAYAFVNGNKRAFLKLFLPILPALAIIEPFLLFSDPAAAVEDPPRYVFFMVVALAVMTPFWTAFGTGWHRAVIYGPEEANAVNPLKLSKDERGYAGFVLALLLVFNLGVFLLLPLSGVLKAYLSPEAVRVVMVAGAGAVSAVMGILALRLSFWLPAKATGTDLSFGDSLRLSRGLTVRLLVALALAAIPIKVLTLLYYGAAGILHVYLFGGQMETLGSRAVFTLLALPTLFLDYVFVAIILTVLTRVYLWAVQNKST